MRQVNKEHSYIMSSTHQSGKVKRTKKKEITGKKSTGSSCLRSVTPAEEHDDTSADDVEPSLLLPQHPLQLPPLLLPLLLHGCQQTLAMRKECGCAKVQVLSGAEPPLR